MKTFQKAFNFETKYMAQRFVYDINYNNIIVLIRFGIYADHSNSLERK